MLDRGRLKSLNNREASLIREPIHGVIERPDKDECKPNMKKMRQAKLVAIEKV